MAILVRCLSPKTKKPIVILYGHQLSGNLKALYDQWQSSNSQEFELFFLTLDPVQGKQLAQRGIRVLQCNRLRDMLRLSRTHTMVTDHGLHVMTPLLHLTDIVFVDVWHGIPFKGFTPEDFTLQHRYNEIWVSSPEVENLYREKFGFNPQLLQALGYARTDQLFQPPAVSSQYRQLANIPSDHKIVLYAPTWKQDDNGRELFPFDLGESAFISAIDEQCRANAATLVIRSHLNAVISKNAYTNVRYCSQKDFPDSEALLLESDILICDWSSIAFDYLALNRPTLFLDVPPPFKNGFSLGPEYRFGRIIADIDALTAALADDLTDPAAYTKQYGESHRKITDLVYGDNTDGNSAQRQLQRLVDATSSHP